MTEIVDLWPNDLSTPDETSPALILKQQASLLAKRTNGRVIAEVITGALPASRLVHSFTLMAPGLGDYRHTIFYAVHQKKKPYPVVLHFGYAGALHDASPVANCSNQHSFEITLRDVFGSDRVRRIIDGLLEA